MADTKSSSISELDRKFLEYSLNQQAKAHQSFGRDVKLAALLLALLLVFFFQYLRLAADETALDQAYGDEFASLTSLLNQFESLNDLLSDQESVWAAEVSQTVLAGHVHVIELDQYVQQLRGSAPSATTAVALPAFLAKCGGLDVPALLQTRAHSPEEGAVLRPIVNTCILDSIPVPIRLV